MVQATPAAHAAFALLCRKFAAVLAENPANPPDLHLVIVEAPAPAYLRWNERPPYWVVRPELAEKPLLDYQPDVIPTLPAHRFLFLGDERRLRQFQQLAREVAEAFRVHDPAVDRWVVEATWEGPQFYMPNLWALFMRDIVANAPGFMRRYRWGKDLATRAVPYDEDELQAWVEATLKNGGWDGQLPPKDVNFTTFTYNVFECSYVALDWVVNRAEVPKAPAEHRTDQPGAAQRIPSERRTRPLRLGEAATLLGLGKDPKVAGKRLKKLMKAETYAFDQLNRQTFVFDINAFPSSVRDEVKPRA